MGQRPDFGVPGYWLYANGRAIVHLVDWLRDAPPDVGPRPHVDHIAFSCDDLEGTELRLKNYGIGYQRNSVPGTNIVQLFCKDPTGFGVELNFEIGSQ